MPRLRIWMSRHRTEIIVIISVFPPAFLATAIVVPRWHWWLLFLTTQALLVFSAKIPDYGDSVRILEALQDTVFKVLELRQEDRITIHLLLNKKKEKCIQWTNYLRSRTGRGRVFGFRHGIVGRTFTSNLCQFYSVPASMDFKQAMKTQWQFTDDEIRLLTQDRRSFLTYPFGFDDPHPRAVLYMDSDDPTRFTETTKPGYEGKIRDLFTSQFEAILSRI